MSKEYNGWSNYETWKANLELLDSDNVEMIIQDDQITEHHELADKLKEMCEEIFEECENSTVKDWALCALQEVNWREIAEHYTLYTEEEETNEESEG